MAAVNASFTIWTNRGSGATSAGTGRRYTAGVDQNDNHQRRSNADSRWPGTGWSFVNPVYQTRMWTQLLGYQYDWLTVPAPPVAPEGERITEASDLRILEDGRQRITEGATALFVQPSMDRRSTYGYARGALRGTG